MSKLRSLNTAFWSDTWIENITPKEKLLFIYLITNEKTNMLGIYEASLRKISFETGINLDEVEIILKNFESASKVKYVNNYVVLVNYMKHQNYNTNMKKSAIDIYNELPNELKIKGLVVSKDNPSEGFESLSNGYGMVRKVEVEDETEIEDEFKYEEEVEKDINDINIDYDKNTIRDIKHHKEHYLKDLRLMNAVSSVKKNNITFEEIPERLEEFHKELESKGRTHETFTEYAVYFLNWNRSGTYNKKPSKSKAVGFSTNR